MTTYKSVIFDFNGTLYWDTSYHNRAWDRFLNHYHIHLSDEEKRVIIYGKNNEDILQGLFHRHLTEPDMQAMINEKEFIYQRICLEHKMRLAPGAVNFLNDLASINISLAIATASEKMNIDFYCQHLKLQQWFSAKQIIYNDRSFRSKPNPDIFLLAMQRINASPDETIIFEDSFAGIKAAENAGTGKIIIVNSDKQDYGDTAHEIITSFDEVSRDLF
ncbi:HAD family phosphatase [bacterium]|nr:HAD family phosphatase [bacterium]